MKPAYILLRRPVGTTNYTTFDIFFSKVTLDHVLKCVERNKRYKDYRWDVREELVDNDLRIFTIYVNQKKGSVVLAKNQADAIRVAFPRSYQHWRRTSYISGSAMYRHADGKRSASVI